MAVTRLGWDGANNDPWPKPWITPAGTVTVQSRRGRLVTPATINYGGIAQAERFGRLQDAEILVLITPGQTWATEGFVWIGIGGPDLTLSGNGAPYHGWTCSTQGQGNLLGISHHIAAAATSLGTGAFTYSASTPAWVRFRKQGNLLRAKVWHNTTNEPGPWNVVVTDTTATSTDQLWHLSICAGNGATATAVTFDVESLVVDDLRPDIRPRRRVRV